MRLSMAWASTLEKGSHGHGLARHQPGGPDAQAGDDGRLQRGRGQRGGPRGRHRAGDAPPHPHLGRSRGGVTVRLADDDPQSVVIRFFDAEGLDIDRERPAQDRAAVPPRGVPSGAGAARSATSTSRPGRSSSTRPTSIALRRRRPIAPAPGFKLVLDLSYGSASFVMPNVLAKLDADVLVVNPYAHDRRA